MSVAGVVLFPGAGSSASHPSLLSLKTALQPLAVACIDFPYRLAGKSFPDTTPVLLDCVRTEVRAFAARLGVETSKIVIGGRSMGGRMCSMAIADIEDSLRVAGLVLMSYPLHPPKKPENLRTEHLARVDVPTLCVSGTKDTFGSPEELHDAFSVVPSVVHWHWVQNGRHELAKADDEIASAVVRFVNSL